MRKFQKLAPSGFVRDKVKAGFRSVSAAVCCGGDRGG